MARRPQPATLIACVALFFSLSGAGLAASRYLITSTAQIKPSVRAQLRGPAGQPGTPGQPGVQGPVGPAGPQGSEGTPAAAPIVAYSLVSAAVTIPPGQTGTAEEACDNGGNVTGGGFTADPGLVVSESRGAFDSRQSSLDSPVWMATASNPTDGALTLEAWVRCGS